jgi:hypothetical protein
MGWESASADLSILLHEMEPSKVYILISKVEIARIIRKLNVFPGLFSLQPLYAK